MHNQLLIHDVRSSFISGWWDSRCFFVCLFFHSIDFHFLKTHCVPGFLRRPSGKGTGLKDRSWDAGSSSATILLSHCPAVIREIREKSGQRTSSGTYPPAFMGQAQHLGSQPGTHGTHLPWTTVHPCWRLRPWLIIVLFHKCSSGHRLILETPCWMRWRNGKYLTIQAEAVLISFSLPFI